MMHARYLFATVAVLALFGCYGPQRDHALDPINRPILHIFGANYDAGEVVVEWEYIGQQTVTSFVVDRRLGSGYVEVGRLDGQNETAQYVRLGRFEDRDLVSGERVSYRVTAIHENDLHIASQSVDVRIPGAQANGVNRDALSLAAQITWEPDAVHTVGYDIVRAVDGGVPETIFRTNEPGVRAFWDRDIRGNALHTYVIESRLASGVVLRSRPLNAQFYRFGAQLALETVQADEAIRLAQGPASVSGGTLALIGRAQQPAVFLLRYEAGQTLQGAPRIVRTLSGTLFPALPGIRPLSVDVIGPRSNDVFPRIDIGGLDADGRVVLAGFAAPLFDPVWEGPSDWTVSTPQAHVRLARDDSGYLFVGAADEIRAFIEIGGQVGASRAPVSVVSDLSVFAGSIWVASRDDARLLRGRLIFSGGALTDIAWEDVSVEAPPVAVAHNAFGQVFVLDVSGHVQMFSTEGAPLLSWALPPGAYEAGDIAVDSGIHLVQISNGRGDILTYVP